MKKITVLFVLLALLATPVYAARPERTNMAQTRTISYRSYAPGNYEFELNNLPGNSEGADFFITRSFLNTMQPGVVAHVDFYMRVNASDPWVHRMGMDIDGGLKLDRQGNPLVADFIGFTWPGVAGPSGRIKVKGNDVRIVAVVFTTFEAELTINSK